MNVTFVNLPINRFDTDDLAPPLGLMQLMTSLHSLPLDMQLLDFNLESVKGSMPDNVFFYDYAIKKILDTDPNIVAFTSMCVNSHLGLELGEKIKMINNKIKTIYGGIHYSSISKILKERSNIDYIIKGEGEEKLLKIIVKLLDSSYKFSNPITVEGHPWSSYKYININEYFDINPMKLLNLETGRGCKYKCPFCYSHCHWDETRNYPIESIISDFNIAYNIGARQIFIVNDNFINDTSFVKRLCSELQLLAKKPSWSCYLTIPDITNDLPEILAVAGCNSVYLGIDAVTSAQKSNLGKSFVKNKECLKQLIQEFVRNKITPTCAFILDPFNWDPTDINEAYQMALKLRLIGAELSLHYLTKYRETLLSKKNNKSKFIKKPDEFRTRMMFDCPEVVYQNELSIKHPDIFPFHARNVEPETRYRKGIFQIHSAQDLITKYPYEILDIVKSNDYNIVDMLDLLYSRIPVHEFEADRLRDLKRIEANIFEAILLNEFDFRPV